jgi:hypothetical protein
MRLIRTGSKEGKDMCNQLESAAAQAEQALGENLTWLDDKLDLLIRQGDPETKMRLAQLNDAWSALCRAGAHKLEVSSADELLSATRGLLHIVDDIMDKKYFSTEPRVVRAIEAIRKAEGK